MLDPNNDDQAYTWSLDATVRLWSYRAGEELSRIVVREPIKYMVIHKDLGVAYLSVQLREGGGRVMLYNMKTGKFSGTAMKTRVAGPLAIAAAGGLAATIDRHSLFVWRTGADIHQPLNLPHTKPYTCLALSSDGSLLAAGDASGRVLLWRGLEPAVPAALRREEHSGKAALGPGARPPLTTVHWHAHPVGCLAFSDDGTYLLSGGAEGVLVLWALETNRPNFLPRLGGPLVGIAPSPADPARFLVRQADNCVRLVNVATMKVETSVMGLRPAPAGLLPPAGVAGGAAALLPAAAGAAAVGGGGGSGVLCVPCENSQLQFYDVARDRHMQIVQVSPRNQVSLTDGPAGGVGAGGAPGSSGAPAAAAQPPPPFVSLVAFSGDGSVMATVDVRPDAGPYGSTEACLKFWDSGRGAGPEGASASTSSSSSTAPPFALNTRVDEPHRDYVAALAYHPTRHLAVTAGGTGADSEFKVWVQERRPAAPGGSGGAAAGPGSAAAARRRAEGATHWRCLSTGGYKGLPLGAAAFSPDGSVLAVAAAARVTLWDAASNALAAVLPPAAAVAVGGGGAAALTQLTFVPGTPYLAAASPSCLTVYNLLTAAVHWALPYGAVSISADAAYGLLAAALPAPRSAPTAGEDGAANGTPSTTKPSSQPPGVHVVVFDPRDASPRFHCHVPAVRTVHLSHLPDAGRTSAAVGGEAAAASCSPLLILREDRAYSLAALPGTLDASGAAADVATLSKAQPLGALEAAFGRTSASGAGAAPMDLDGPGAGPTGPAAAGDRGKPRWAALFDAPSHALPPPAALASAFLSLLTTADA
ncbi:hypothetical protein HYH03_018242 [Edaphochlamys debaryana]|uniref:WD repeat-containing protein 75 second beta-propeller domain-containing protein n=1 Tax=Edaphochlamys debaryana TaxID=47281 RepID=A0A835XFN9_9CHLO|nr:hypothetical protein HYH03_018242 [Edaphochlamys debaryana]|eukprot:KAG2482851.1 hypothetical protein HYH03_018242 [Edaphochlamys debaryana]